MDNTKLAELLFGNITKTAADYEKEYPVRELCDNQKVTRFAPSPTGFLHIGGLFAAFVAERVAHISGGVFYLRIEDTDKKREVEDGISGIISGLRDFGIEFDEGMTSETGEKGQYGPYVQSKRKEIYHAFCKDLVARGFAYPCFCSAEALSAVRERQEADKLTPGYYGAFAQCRTLTLIEIEEKIKAGIPYVVRLRSPGDESKRFSFDDGIKGRIEMPENVNDIVLLKTDGIPTYHFAHAVDDHLMGTTDVIRGDEWISSVPIHVQLFDVLGFGAPKYSHISPIMKEDEETGGKRKLSKRKDPEAAVTYYREVGYPKEAVLEYLLTIANSNYEEWRLNNSSADRNSFDFSLENMSKAGALFDLNKLTDLSKTFIATLNAEEVYNRVYAWAMDFDTAFAKQLSDHPAYAKSIFAIERGGEKPRKDIAKWEEVSEYISYFYSRPQQLDFADNLSRTDMAEILRSYKAVYSADEAQEDWFPKVRDMAEALGYAKAPKFYKKNPEDYKGHVGDVSTVLRVAITGRRNTPDLYQILQVLGYDEVIARLDAAERSLQ